MSEKLTEKELLFALDDRFRTTSRNRNKQAHAQLREIVENHYSDSTGYGDLLTKLTHIIEEQRKLLDEYAELAAKLTGASRPRARRER